MNTLSKSVMYGNNEYAAVEISLDDSDHQYFVQVWENGGAAAVAYFPTWKECFDYVQTLPVAEEGGPTIAGIYSRVHGDGPLPEVRCRFVGSEEAEWLTSRAEPGSSLLLLSELAEKPLFEVEDVSPKGPC